MPIPDRSDREGARQFADRLTRMGTTPTRDASIVYQAMRVADTLVRFGDIHPEAAKEVMGQLDMHVAQANRPSASRILASGVLGFVRTSA